MCASNVGITVYIGIKDKSVLLQALGAPSLRIRPCASREPIAAVAFAIQTLDEKSMQLGRKVRREVVREGGSSRPARQSIRSGTAGAVARSAHHIIE